MQEIRSFIILSVLSCEAVTSRSATRLVLSIYCCFPNSFRENSQQIRSYVYCSNVFSCVRKLPFLFARSITLFDTFTASPLPFSRDKLDLACRWHVCIKSCFWTALSPFFLVIPWVFFLFASFQTREKKPGAKLFALSQSINIKNLLCFSSGSVTDS